MFKKNLWVAGLILAVAIAFTGCLDPLTEDGNQDGLVDTTLLDLSASLQDLPTGLIDKDAQFKSIFAGIPVQSGGEFANGHVTYEIKRDGGKNVLQVNAYASWGAGLDLQHENIQFRAGDTIYVKGTLVSASTPNFYLNVDSAVGKAGGWEHKALGAFEATVTLTAADVAAIAGRSPKVIRLRSDKEAVYILEQVKVVGKRAGNYVRPPASYQSPSGSFDVSYDASTDEFFFYVDLNKIIRITNPPTNFSSLDTPPTYKISGSSVDLIYAYKNTGNRPTVAFEFTADQTQKVYDNRSSIKIEWDAAHTFSGASYRYSIGNKEGKGSAWNAMGTLPTNIFTTTAVGNTAGSNPWQGAVANSVQSPTSDNPNTHAMILQAMGATGTPEDTVTISSIKISWKAPTIAVISAFTFTQPTTGYRVDNGFFANTALKGNVIMWQNAGGTAAADFDYEIWDTNKAFPRFKAQTYLATIKLVPQSGYLIDGWANGKEFTVNTVSNTTYNSNDQTIKVQVAATGSKADVWQLGDLDDPAKRVSNYGGNAIVVYDFNINSNMGQFVDAGATIEKVGAGINVTNRNANDWRGIDIKISSGDINLDVSKKRYKVSVAGYYPGTGATGNIVLGGASSPNDWVNNVAVNTVVTTNNGYFTLQGELNADYSFKGNGNLRINFNGINGDSFRLFQILIEDINIARVPIIPATPIILQVNAPAFDGISDSTGSDNDPNNIIQPFSKSTQLGYPYTQVQWKLGDTNIPKGQKFKNGAYTAVITLYANAASTFNGIKQTDLAGVVDITDNSIAATINSFVVSNVGRVLTITATFPATDLTGATVVPDVAISGITAPAINTLLALPTSDSTLTVAGASSAVVYSSNTGFSVVYKSVTYSGNTEYMDYYWTFNDNLRTPNANNTNNGGGTYTARGSTVYTARINLIANDGYIFKGATTTAFTYTGATVTPTISADGRTCQVDIAFPKTADPTKVPSASYNFAQYTPRSTYVAAPSLTPVGSFGNGGLDSTGTGPIIWTPAPSGGQFQSGVVYTATFTLRASAIAYTFDGASPWTFSGNSGAVTVKQTPQGDLAQSNLLVQVTFPKTVDEKITAATVTVTPPSIGAAFQYYPVISTTIAGSNPTPAPWISDADKISRDGEIVWTDSTGKVVAFDTVFTAATGYTATFKLKANENYIFDENLTITGTGGTQTITGKGTRNLTVKVVY